MSESEWEVLSTAKMTDEEMKSRKEELWFQQIWIDFCKHS